MHIHTATQYGRILTLALAATLIVMADRTAFAQDTTATVTGGSAAPAVAPTDAAGAAQIARPPARPPAPAPEAVFTEPRAIRTTVDYVAHKYGNDTGEVKSGFYPEVSNMLTGAGWLSIGPGYRHYFSDDRVLVDGSMAVSWHLYKMAQARVELPKLGHDHFTAGVQGMWQDATQVNYYGVGPDAPEEARSLYRMQTTDVVAYGTVKPNTTLSFGGQYGFLRQPKVMEPGGTFLPSFPSTIETFPDDAGVALTTQPNYSHGQAFIANDTRDHRSYPSRGGFYRAAFNSFSSGTGPFSFSQYQAEGQHFIPLADQRWVLGFRGWTVFSQIPEGNSIPFYLLPTIGGNNTLRDYLSYRFHDNNIVVVNAESRLAIYEHMDLALFFDAGNVAAAYGDLNLHKTSYGAGLRLHTDTATFGRVDVAYGAEGWHLVFRTSDPFRLSREKRRTINAPFNP